MDEIVHIPLNQLTSPEHDSRISTNFEADQELIESVRSIGILLPLLIKRKGKKYEIIAGHRRYKAALQVGLSSAPCVKISANDTDTEKIKLHENLHRLPLGHVEQGLTFQNLKENFTMTELQISVLVGKSVPYISQHLSLIHADPMLIKDVNDRRISFSVSRELLKCSHTEDLDYLREWAARDGASVEVVHAWVEEANKRRDTSPPTPLTSTTPYIPPPPTSPTFTCQACQVNHPIRELTPARLCTVCHRAIFDAIAEERDKPI